MSRRRCTRAESELMRLSTLKPYQTSPYSPAQARPKFGASNGRDSALLQRANWGRGDFVADCNEGGGTGCAAG
jgi:hypothetical protein